MKKLIYISAIMAAAFCSCTKQELQESSAEKQIIRAHVTVNAVTKLALTDTNPGMTSVWEEGDTFKAIQDGSTIVTFTLEDGAGTAEGIFSAEATGVTEDTKWVALLGSAASEHTSEFHCAFMNQTGKLEDLQNYAYVKATGAGSEPTFNFANGDKLAYILRVKLPAGVKCIEYVPCAYKKVTGSDVSNVYDKNDNTLYSNLKTSTITLDEASAKGDCIYIAVPAVKHQAKADSYADGQAWGNLKSGVIITILNNTSALADGSNGTVVNEDLTEGKIATVDMSEMEFMLRCVPSMSNVITVSRGAGSFSWESGNIKQAVTGVTTYWCPFNIGASSEEEVGNYYSFGELEPRTTYNFSNYSLRSGTPTSSSINHHYCISSKWSKSSTTTFNSIACSRYDVARVKWGSAWRMPYTIECYALHNYTYSSGDSDYAANGTVNGKAGIKIFQVSGGNGYLFFPQSGHYEGATLVDGSVQTAFRTADQRNRSYGDAGYDQSYVYISPYDANTLMDGSGKDRAKYGTPVRPVLNSSVLDWE